MNIGYFGTEKDKFNEFIAISGLPITPIEDVAGFNGQWLFVSGIDFSEFESLSDEFRCSGEGRMS